MDYILNIFIDWYVLLFVFRENCVGTFLFYYLIIYGLYFILKSTLGSTYLLSFFKYCKISTDTSFVCKNYFTEILIFVSTYLIFYLYFFFFYSYDQNVVFFKLFPGESDIYIEFSITPLNIILSLMVDIITFIIIIYSFWYMSLDKNKNLFFLLLYLFSLVMKLLIYSNSFFTFLIFWEFVGLFSFLLIFFWNNRIEAGFAGLKALILNKVGDIFLVLACLGLIKIYDSENITIIKSKFCKYVDYLYFNFNNNDITISLIIYSLGLAAIIKSAQFLFHIWLLSAMEGPTPVSALLHAATMVTAGVILIIKFYFLFENNVNFNIILSFFGISSGIVGALLACSLFDLKKIIAGSTMSQIGLMMIALSSGLYKTALFHLIVHAFFKASLFLTAGIFIHTRNNEQDIRKLDGIFYTNPFTMISFIIASFALVGFPFTSGFYSKDYICDLLYVKQNYLSYLNFYCFLLISVLSCLYICRLLLIFFKNKKNIWNCKRESLYIFKDTYPTYIFYILMLLNIIVIFVGYFCNSFFDRYNTFFFLESHDYINKHFFLVGDMLLPVILPILSFFIFGFSYIIYYHFGYLFYNINILFLKKKVLEIIYSIFFIDIIYDNIVRKFLYFSNYIYVHIERGLFEYMFHIFFIKSLTINIKKYKVLFLSNYNFKTLNYFYFFCIFYFLMLCCFFLSYLYEPFISYYIFNDSIIFIQSCIKKAIIFSQRIF